MGQMLTDEEIARANAEVELARFLNTVQRDPDYWNDYEEPPTLEEMVASGNFEIEYAEAPVLGIRMVNPMHLMAPRWIFGAKRYADTVIFGIGATHLRPDSPSATKAIETFETLCGSIDSYLWNNHFSLLAQFWNHSYKPLWQEKFPDETMMDMTEERFGDCLHAWHPAETFRPGELKGDLITEFWDKRATLHTPTDDEPEPARQATSSGHSIGAQIDVFRQELRMTVEELAEAIDIDPRSVYRHIAGTIPRQKQIREYEKLFSEKLEKKVSLSQTSVKRQ